MKFITGSIFLVAGILLILTCIAVLSMNDGQLIINGADIHSTGGIAAACAGGAIGLLAALFVLGVTGLVLIGVPIGLTLVAIVIVGVVALTITPLLLPLLLIAMLVLVIKKCLHTSDATQKS